MWHTKEQWKRVGLGERRSGAGSGVGKVGGVVTGRWVWRTKEQWRKVELGERRSGRTESGGKRERWGDGKRKVGVVD